MLRQCQKSSGKKTPSQGLSIDIIDYVVYLVVYNNYIYGVSLASWISSTQSQSLWYSGPHVRGGPVINLNLTLTLTIRGK